MVDITSKNLNIRLSEKENITSSLTSENLHIIICDCEKMEIKQALCYIKSGQQDINTYVSEVVIPRLDTYEQTAENQMQNCMERIRQYADEITEHDYATTTELNTAFSTKQDIISDLSAIRSGASLGATAVQPSGLATVAATGSYNDLLNKPSIPAAQVNSDWNAASGVAQILNKPTIPTVPTNISAFTNDSGYITASDLPTVNNATLTITQGGVSKGTFTANASSDVTIALDSGVSVIETYSNGTSWYRIYSDGWCEQGGQTTTNGNITLLKPYSNTDFAVFVADGQNIGNTSCTNAYIVDNSTINIFISWCASAIWEAKGYISQGA